MGVACLATLICVGLANSASAQIRRTAWGITVDFTPDWSVPEYQRPLLDIEASTVEGRELTIGVVRGRMVRGYWGIAYVRRTVSEGGAVERLNAGKRSVTVAESARLNGVEVSGFAPAVTLGERAQLGVFLGAGIGRWTGTVRRSVDGDVPATIEASEFLGFPQVNDVVPLLRLEFGGTAILHPTVKLRASAGVAFPGAHIFRVGLIYFFNVG
jgi:hypothetical protein